MAELIGIVFFIPLVGLVTGGLRGACFAGLDKTGLDRDGAER